MHWLNDLFDGLLPSPCLACGEVVSLEKGAICGDCRAAVARDFVRFSAPPSIVEGVALGPYQGILGRLVREAKYNKNGPLRVGFF